MKEFVHSPLDHCGPRCKPPLFSNSDSARLQALHDGAPATPSNCLLTSLAGQHGVDTPTGTRPLLKRRGNVGCGVTGAEQVCLPTHLPTYLPTYLAHQVHSRQVGGRGLSLIAYDV